MIIGPDVSFYDDNDDTIRGIDFNRMGSVSEFVIVKVGQKDYIDSDFEVNWNTSKLAGIPRGSYWFYDSRYDPKKQAEIYIEALGNDLGELPLFADFEESYNGTYKGWRNWKIFLDRLAELAPSKEIGIYTAYYYWKDNAVDVGADLNYFGQYLLWVANYGVSSPLLPKPWTDWLFWQYTDSGSGSYYGTESSAIDLNYFNGTLQEFNDRFDIPDDVPSEIKESWWGGVGEYRYGYRQYPRPFYFHILKFRKDSVEDIFTNGPGFLGTSLYFWETRGQPDIVINGDEGSPYQVKALGCSEGSIYKLSNGETSIQWDKDNDILGMSIKPLSGVWTSCGGSNILLENGELHWSILDEAPEPDPRTSLFWNDTYYFIVMIDGRNNGTLGLSKKELAEFALALGATDGHNFDGGDSCQLLMNKDGNPIIKNNPPDGTLHGVVNHLGFRLKKEIQPPDNGGGDMTTQFNIKAGARAYSPDGARDWGLVEKGLGYLPQDVTIDAEGINGKTRLASPLWSNGKKFCVEPQYIEVVEVTDPDPDPDPDPTLVVIHDIKIYDDGRISVDNGEPY